MTERFNWLWTEKQHRRWAGIRTKGRWHFILYRGIAGWGGWMFLILGVCPVAFGFPHRAVGTLSYWAWNVGLWVVAVCVWGWGTWAWSERCFGRAEGQVGDSDQPPSNNA